MTKAQMVFKKAVRLAKTFVGDWNARMKLALRIIWAAVKKGANAMVELTGSKKQISWAEDIRKAFIKVADDVKSQIKLVNGGINNNIDQYRIDVDDVFARVLAVKEAHVWIENMKFITRTTKTGYQLVELVGGEMANMLESNVTPSEQSVLTCAGSWLRKKDENNVF